MKILRSPFSKSADNNTSSISHTRPISKWHSAVVIAGFALVLNACGAGDKEPAVVIAEPETNGADGHGGGSEEVFPESRFGGRQLTMPMDILVGNPAANAERNAYYGDLHVHTTYSFDAFAFGTLATPHDAYRYAKGGSD